MESLNSKKIIITISCIILTLLLLTNVSFGKGTKELANEFNKYLDTDINKLLGTTYSQNRNWYEDNMLCLESDASSQWKSGAYVSRIVGIVDINYDGPNTTNIYKFKGATKKYTGSKNPQEIRYFNALSKVCADTRGKRSCTDE